MPWLNMACRCCSEAVPGISHLCWTGRSSKLAECAPPLSCSVASNAALRNVAGAGHAKPWLAGQVASGRHALPQRVVGCQLAPALVARASIMQIAGGAGRMLDATEIWRVLRACWQMRLSAALRHAKDGMVGLSAGSYPGQAVS